MKFRNIFQGFNTDFEKDIKKIHKLNFFGWRLYGYITDFTDFSFSYRIISWLLSQLYYNLHLFQPLYFSTVEFSEFWKSILSQSRNNYSIWYFVKSIYSAVTLQYWRWFRNDEIIVPDPDPTKNKRVYR